jgi:hypothetical protein
MLLVPLLACSSLDDPFGTAACPPWSLDLTQEPTAADLVLEEPVRYVRSRCARASR